MLAYKIHNQAGVRDITATVTDNNLIRLIATYGALKPDNYIKELGITIINFDE